MDGFGVVRHHCTASNSLSCLPNLQRQELRQLQEALSVAQAAGTPAAARSLAPSGEAAEEGGVLFYSIRASPLEPAPLQGPSVDEQPPAQPGDGSLLGQVDSVQAGQVAGWACRRSGGDGDQPLQVTSFGRKWKEEGLGDCPGCLP